MYMISQQYPRDILLDGLYSILLIVILLKNLIKLGLNFIDELAQMLMKKTYRKKLTLKMRGISMKNNILFLALLSFTAASLNSMEEVKTNIRNILNELNFTNVYFKQDTKHTKDSIRHKI